MPGKPIEPLVYRELPHEYIISFRTEVIPEPGDTREELLAYVRRAAEEWLPEGFVFDVTPVEKG